jgi:hypothetical protein
MQLGFEFAPVSAAASAFGAVSATKAPALAATAKAALSECRMCGVPLASDAERLGNVYESQEPVKALAGVGKLVLAGVVLGAVVAPPLLGRNASNG